MIEMSFVLSLNSPSTRVELESSAGKIALMTIQPWHSPSAFCTAALSLSGESAEAQAGSESQPHLFRRLLRSALRGPAVAGGRGS
jgi:hypothetical protein